MSLIQIRGVVDNQHYTLAIYFEDLKTFERILINFKDYERILLDVFPYKPILNFTKPGRSFIVFSQNIVDDLIKKMHKLSNKKTFIFC